MKKRSFLQKYLWLLILAGVIVAVLLGWFLSLVFSGRLIVNPVILSIGTLQIRWYGLLIALAILLAYFIGRSLALKEGIKEDHLIEALLIGVIAGVIGARLYYVAFNWGYYSRYPQDIFKIWQGGLAIHGGVFGAMISTFLYTRLRKGVSFGFLQALDIFASVLPLAQAIGRWGNFFNYEAYGGPTSVPWKMYVPPSHRMPGYEGFEYFHPTFLYESLWDLATFAVVFTYHRKLRKSYGETLALYFIMYSAGRFAIEAMRLDSLYAGDLRVAQVVSIVLMCTGALMMFILRKKGKHLPKEMAE
ncbi:MAG TPA: prolipoprotein diacylglyceryl transferase [Thermotogae bacterium]|nr:phosphatidylglycerol---prolipoprotein diacylglyceryl transferase [Thermotogota bacterium]HCZ06244.1 prolipoprotein diacylglyceryl transferase [Thermotogota bacterium]